LSEVTVLLLAAARGWLADAVATLEAGRTAGDVLFAVDIIIDLTYVLTWSCIHFIIFYIVTGSRFA
jgi:hypothetical protein